MRNDTCLNGYWDFLPIYDDGLSFEEAMDLGGWITDRYLVPSSWRTKVSSWNYADEMYDVFRYPQAWEEARRGVLRRRVTAEKRPGERFFLKLDAVAQSCRILVNGVEVAASDDMYLPVEAEVTDLMVPGKNDLEICVLCGETPTVTRPDGAVKLLAPRGTWFSNMARGIWQDAWLLVRPEVCLRDPFLLTKFSDHTLTASVELDGGEGDVTAEVLDGEGNCVLTLGESLTAFWPEAHLWMPDDPYLYTCRFTLRRNGEVADVLEQRFGFREVTVQGHDLFLNGVKLHLRGDAWHYQGFVMQRKEYAANWYAMEKEIGVNLVRPHGLPYPPCFYDAADEAGMLVLDETAIYGSGKDMQADDPRYLDACRRHVRSHVRRDRNHPSVILWSLQNEMRWVDGRDGYQKAIPGLMDIYRREDPSGRLVSCDGDNRLLTDEMMQVVSMHYNIDGRISDWDRKKPLTFGEHGSFHYPAPQSTAALGGRQVYDSYWAAMDAAALREALFLRVARREEVTAVCPYDYVHYMNKAMPFEDRTLDPGDVTAPGPHPSILKAYSLTVNNGQMPDLPLYLPQPALRTMLPETAMVALLPEECDEVFFSGEVLQRRYRLYNDTYRARAVTLRCIAELDRGQVVFAGEETFDQPAGDGRLLEYGFSVPGSASGELTVRFTVFHDGTRALERAFSYKVAEKDDSPVTGKTVAVFGGGVPGWIGENVTEISGLDGLAGVRADLLILGEDLPYDQASLQPVLQVLTQEHRVGAILILAQDRFAPGDLRLSRRPFFSADVTGPHPVTDGLALRDLRFWGGANPEDSDTEGTWMVRSAFDRPGEDGWRVLLECSQGDFGWGGTNWCALLEGETEGIPVLLTQLRLLENLDTVPAARELLRRSVRYLAEKTEPAFAPCAILRGHEIAERAERILAAGGTVIVPDAAPEDASALSDLLGKPVDFTESPVYQVSVLSDPLTRNLSPAEVTGLDHTMYSTAAQKNVPVARYALSAENVRPLLVTADAPWTSLCLDGVSASSGALKMRTVTRQSNTPCARNVYAFAAPAMGGTLVVTTLLTAELPRLHRAVSLIAANAGARYETSLFRRIKPAERYAVPEFMYLPVDPAWDYDAAVAYHAAPDFFLNNLGEGTYGWMQRVSAAEGCAVLKGAGRHGALVTVFADCGLNHDPEKREPGVVPDPSIVPDLTVTCNTAFDVYVNGRKHAGLSDAPDGPVKVLLEDVLLEKGLNRIFFRLSPGPEDLILGAVFRDKMGDDLTDAVWRLTLD